MAYEKASTFTGRVDGMPVTLELKESEDGFFATTHAGRELGVVVVATSTGWQVRTPDPRDYTSTYYVVKAKNVGRHFPQGIAGVPVLTAVVETTAPCSDAVLRRLRAWVRNALRHVTPYGDDGELVQIGEVWTNAVVLPADMAEVTVSWSDLERALTAEGWRESYHRGYWYQIK